MDGIYITKTDFNTLVKKISYLEEYIKNTAKEKRTRWVSQQIAMDEIGCKRTKLTELRLSGKLEWRYAGKGKGIMILRRSIDDYNNSQSTLPQSKVSSYQ